MRKFLRAVLPLLFAPFVLIGVSSAAHAAVTSSCDYAALYCDVNETMGSGFCDGQIFGSSGSHFVNLQYEDTQGTGYDCRFWMERNVNNSGWYNESGYLILSPNNSYITQAYYDGPGYQAEVCFQFLWSGTSNPGAVHCSPALGGL